MPPLMAVSAPESVCRELPGAQDELIKPHPRRLGLSRIVLPSRRESRSEAKQLLSPPSAVTEATILIRNFTRFFFFDRAFVKTY